MSEQDVSFMKKSQKEESLAAGIQVLNHSECTAAIRLLTGRSRSQSLKSMDVTTHSSDENAKSRR